MIKEYNFSLLSFEKLNEIQYKKRTLNSHIFHSLEWMKIIKASFAINYNIGCLKKGDEIIATIPFVTYRNYIKGLCALPLHFSSYHDSIVANDDIAKEKLLEEFYKYCQKFKLYTQLAEVNNIKGFKSFLGYSIYTMRLRENISVENQILSQSNKRVKGYIKNAINSDMICISGKLELLDKFYKLYLQNMKELGTPPHPKKYFKNILQYLPNSAQIILVESQKQISSGMFVLKVSRSELFSYVTCTPRLYQRGESSYLIYLQAAKEAKKFGCNVVNFGRSIDESGPSIFKKRFGLEPTPLLIYSSYKNWTVTNPEKSRLKYAVAIWKKIPTILTRLGGIVLSKHVI